VPRSDDTLDGSRPNVVLIMTDQQRGGVTARRGFPLDTMPFVDSIAERGTWTDRHYAAVPQCVPGRASVLTGRTSSGNGVRINPQIKAPTYERDLVDVMNGSGYEVGFSGKDHCYLDGTRMDHWYTLGHQGGSPRNESQRRYDEWLEELGFGVSFEPAPVDPEDTCAGRIVSDSIEWIDSLDEERPFFLNMWLPEPHSPYHAPEPYFSLFDPDDVPDLPSDASDAEKKGFDYVVAQNANLLPERLPEGVTFEEALPEIRSIYYGMIRVVDDQLLRFVEFLEDRGLREDTLLVFTSDHGDYAGSYGMMRKGAGLCEALTNVPLVVDGPGVERSDGAHPMHTALWDLLPTLADAVGAEIPRGVQGRSFWPVVTGRDYPEAEFDSVYLECGDGGVPYREPDKDDIDASDRQYALTRIKRGVRSGNWKLVHDTAGRHSFRLYDIEADPDELNDVADEHPEALADLKDELLRWSGRLDAFEHPNEPKAKRNPHNWWDHPDWDRET
jgi:arylsulfatase A-like enzyme